MKKILLMLFCIIFLVGCSENNNKNTSKEKILAELDYCDTKLTDIMNKLNNISLDNYELISDKVQISEKTEESTSSGGEAQSSSSQTSEQSTGENQEISVTEMKRQSILNADKEKIDWDLLRSEIEVINSYWNVITLDLYKENIPNEDIINFSNILNQATISINAEDKLNTLLNLSNLYGYIPKFLNNLSADSETQNIKNTKASILNAYVSVNRDDWAGVRDNMLNAENSFTTILSNIDYSENKEYKINKTYIAIKDMENAINTQDKSLYFLKYKNLMESLNTL